jgi:transposase
LGRLRRWQETFHWVSVLDDAGEVVLSHRVEATEQGLEAACSQIAGLSEERKVALDVLGGPATLLLALLAERGEQIFHLPGLAVNRAREAYRGGEHKSDRNDAFVIADQLRMRWRSLQEICPKDEALAEMRALVVGHRRDLIQDQTRRITRLRGLLLEICPALEATLNLNREGTLQAVTKVATPASIRRLGEARLGRWLKSRGVRKWRVLAQRIVAAAKAQKCELPAAEVKAALVAEIALEVLRTRKRIAALDDRLEELLASNQQASIMRSLPGMGTVFTAEFLAEVGEISRFNSTNDLAAAAGLAPVLRSSGSVSYQRRPKRGNRTLKRLLYRSAFCAISHHGASESFYQRKRTEGKTHHRAMIALARRRVNVLWAMLRDGNTYVEQSPEAA